MQIFTDQQFYLCPPKYFEIKFIINDWMDKNVQVDPELAISQWNSLVGTYQKLGANLSLIDPVEGIPDLTFSGDSIFLYGDQAISSRFKFTERQPEVEIMAKLFSKLGYQVSQLPDGIHFEGNAEAMIWNGRLFGGYGIRSDLEVYQFLSNSLDLEVVTFKLNQPFYHFDTSFCPINSETLAFVPDAFNQKDQDRLKKLVKNVIPVDYQEADYMACNSKAVGDTVVISSKHSPKFAGRLKNLGVNVIELDLSEYRKSGAGGKCLTLEAYRPV